MAVVTAQDLPSYVALNGQVWAVRSVAGDADELEGCIGICDSDEFCIYIHADLVGAQLQNTFFHELCHAIYYTSPTKAMTGSGDEEHIEESVVLFATDAAYTILGSVDFDFGFQLPGCPIHRKPIPDLG